MITNKDISIDKDGSIILNGDKYPLASQAEIEDVKDDVSALETLVGDISQTGITGNTVAAQLTELDGNLITMLGQIGDLNFAVISQQFTDVDITRSWGVLYESTQRYGINIASLNLTNPPKAAFLSLAAGSSPVLFEQIAPSTSEVPFYFVRPNNNLTAYSATVNCLVIY